MMKISSKASTNLSIALSIVFFVALVVGMAILPMFVKILIDTPDNIGFRDFITDGERMLVLVVAYLIFVVAMIADGILFLLLLRVKNELVFTEKSIALIRGVSWCAFAVGLLFLILGYYFQLALVVAAAAVFLGLCLRVVKNVIETATEIKYENDLTV